MYTGRWVPLLPIFSCVYAGWTLNSFINSVGRNHIIAFVVGLADVMVAGHFTHCCLQFNFAGEFRVGMTGCECAYG